PLDLADILGKNELVKALGTKDENEAKRLLWPVVEAWNRQFDDMRSRRMLTADDKADAVWQHYTGTLARDDRIRLHVGDDHGSEFDQPTPAARRQFEAHARQAKLDAMRKHLVEGETALIADEVADYIDRNKLLIDPLSTDGGDLAR